MDANLSTIAARIRKQMRSLFYANLYGRLRRLPRPSATSAITSELATLPANRCPFSWCGELAPFTEDFGEAVGESVEATARSSVWQRPTKHLERVLSS